MKRQLDDYYDRFYNKLSEHFHILAADNFAKAKMMADWKANVRSRWDAIEIKSIEAGNGLNATVEAGKEYEVTVVVDEKGLDDAIGIESVIIRREDGQDHIYEVIPLLPVSKNGNLYTFKATSRYFQRWKLQAGLPYVSQECFVTSPTRFLLCTMVLMNSKRICKNNV